MDSIQPPKSPTLLPPRKSVELEDPGAHDLESSNDDKDIFMDAHDSQQSPSSLSSQGQVSTTGQKYGIHSALPNELAVIAEGSQNEISTRANGQKPWSSRGGVPVPMTVVEKVDPTQPSHGEIPGTAAHSIRKADAVPDAILQAPPPGGPSRNPSPSHNIPPSVPIPRTVVTRVDSQPAHGEIPGTDAYRIRTQDATPDMTEKKGDIPGWPTSSTRSKHIEHIDLSISVEGNSPIAADGGFGPMACNDNEDDEEQNDEDVRPFYNEYDRATESDDNDGYEDQESERDGSGDDFDDFEEGRAPDDFGDFGHGIQEPAMAGEFDRLEPPEPPPHLTECPFPVLDFSGLKSLEDIITATSPHLSALFPAAQLHKNSPASIPADTSSVLLTDRSLSLWSQLVTPPPLQPPNWTRSRIRRLLLVSLGVPVDLDEILPASKQKKLVLPFTSRDSLASREPRKGSTARLKQSEVNASSSSIDSSPGILTTTNGHTTKSGSRKRKGPGPPPEFDVISANQLCGTTEAAIEAFTDAELKAHVQRLEQLTQRGRELLQYWLRRKEAAVGDKEAFEGVIENLVRHARRVRN